MKTSDFFYELPEELIAQNPKPDRVSSRLMLVNKESGEVSHYIFSDILNFLERGDCLVLNDTRVIPARLYGKKEGMDKAVEVLLLKRIDDKKWEALVKPGKKLRTGAIIKFGDNFKGEIVSVKDDGNRIIEFDYDGIFEELLDKYGEMPLPPYITDKLENKERYQTVYSKHEGSAAAPTAGLHFTEELLKKIEEKGIEIAKVTLHVGLGTFRPVKVEDVNNHIMHSEWYKIDKENANKINRAKREGKRVICVGTTSCRVLETVADDRGILREEVGETSIFIYPGYTFKVVDALITNFHLPESTLIMLVSALVGRDNILAAYKIAVEEKYRFFSFGDAMLII